MFKNVTIYPIQSRSLLSRYLRPQLSRLVWLTILVCLVISHRRTALKLADRILVLKEGCLEAQGTLEELLQSSFEMQRLWRGTDQ